MNQETQKKAINNAICPLVEGLEERLQLSVSLDSGTQALSVTGTENVDNITVLRVGTDYKVSVKWIIGLLQHL